MEAQRPPRIMVAICTLGDMKLDFVKSLIKYVQSPKLHQSSVLFIEHSVIHRARNSAVVSAVEKGMDYLLFIDDDMTFPPDAVDKLLVQQKDIIGALCFSRLSKNKPVISKIKNNRMVGYSYDEVPTWSESFQVPLTGTGFLLINLSVFKKMEPPFFYWGRPKDFGLERDPFPNDEIGEDVTFCLNAGLSGFEVWVDPTIEIGHINDFAWKNFPEIDMSTKIDILIPTMGRFNLLKPLVKNIQETTRPPHLIIFITDEKEVKDMFKDRVDVFVWDPGKDNVSYSKRINWAFKTDHLAEFFFTGSNDIHFMKDWDTEAMTAFQNQNIGVVAVNDGLNINGTNFLIRKKYIEEHGGTFDGDGEVFFNGYRHNFCDTELLFKVGSERAHKKVDSSQVFHNHYLNKKAKIDEVYKIGQKFYEEDEKKFKARLDKFIENERTKIRNTKI